MAPTKKQPARTLILSLLVGLFVVLGTAVLCDLAARLLPTRVEQATLVGRDTHETILPDLATGTYTFASSRRVVLTSEDGTRFTVAAPKALYDRAIPGLMSVEGTSVTIRRSALFGKLVEIEVVERPLVDLRKSPTLRTLLGGSDQETRAKVTTYDMHLPYVLSIGGLSMLGLMMWVMVRLPRKEEYVWPLFSGAMLVSVALGVWWWAA